MKNLFAFSMISVLIPMFASANGQSHIACQLNRRATQALVAQKQKGMTKASVSETELSAAEFVIENGKLTQGSSLSADDTTVKVGDEGFTDGELEAVGLSQERSVLTAILSAEGHDHLRWNFKINLKTGRAILDEDYFYDCGEPGKAYGVFDCEVF